MLIKSQIKMDKEIEIQRECLFAHEHFNAMDMFKLLDQEKKGYITIQDLDDIAHKHSLDFYHTDEVMQLFDKDGDG